MSQWPRAMAGGLWLAGTVLWLAPASALEVSIRGESELRWDVERMGTAVWVEAQLVDDVGEPLPQREVGLRLVGEQGVVDEVAEHTDFHGRLEGLLEGKEGEHRLQARFDGSHHVSGTAREMEVMLERRPADITMEVPRWAWREQSSIPLQAHISIDGVGWPGYATVWVEGREVASMGLDHLGRGELDLGPYLSAGDQQVEVSVSQASGGEIGRERAWVRAVDEVDIDGQVEEVFERQRRGVMLQAVISDGEERLEGVEASLIWEGESDIVEERVESDQRGGVEAFFEASRFGEGPYQSRIEVDLGEGQQVMWEGEIRDGTSGVEGRWLQFLAWAVLVAGVAWASTQTLGVLVARRRSGEKEEEALPDEEQMDPVEPSTSGIQEPVSTEGGECSGWRLVAWDPWRGQVIDGAKYWVDEHVQTVNGQGALVIDEEEAPRWSVRVEAPGFMGRDITAQDVPTRGLVRVKMVPVPLEVQRRFRELARQLGHGDRWGELTPREWGRRLAEEELTGEAQQRLEQLVKVVEKTNFSAHDYDEEIVDEVRLLVRSVLAAKNRAGQGGRYAEGR